MNQVSPHLIEFNPLFRYNFYSDAQLSYLMGCVCLAFVDCS